MSSRPSVGFGESPGSRSARTRGFTLIEILVVVVVIAIMAGIGIGELSKISRREALTAMSIQVSALMQQAQVVLRQKDAITFLKLGPTRLGVWRGQQIRNFRDLQLLVDNGNGTFDDPAGGGGDTVAQTISISLDEFALSVARELPAVKPFSNTSVLPSGATTVWGTKDSCVPCTGMQDDTFVIGINFRGQTIGPDGNTITAARLGLTHADMANGNLSPLIDYEMSVNPIWEVAVKRTVEGKVY